MKKRWCPHDRKSYLKPCTLCPQESPSSPRLEALEEYAQNPGGFGARRAFSQLNQAERNLVRGFIALNDALGHLEFERAAIRLFLDDPAKPKRWALIEEVLVGVNATVHVKPKNRS